MVWYLQLCMSLAHFFGKPYGFWVTGLVSGSQPAWLIRVIECFSNVTDELVCEFVLPNVELTELQRMWKRPPDNPMVGLLFY